MGMVRIIMGPAGGTAIGRPLRRTLVRLVILGGIMWPLIFTCYPLNYRPHIKILTKWQKILAVLCNLYTFVQDCVNITL